MNLKTNFRKEFKQYLEKKTDLLNKASSTTIEDFFEIPVYLQFRYVKKFFKIKGIEISVKESDGFHYPKVKGLVFIKTMYEDKNEALNVLIQEAINVFESKSLEVKEKKS